MRKEFGSLTILMAILTLSVTLASAQEPSPAGGKFVSFIEDGSYAVAADKEAFDKDLESFMIEAWIYVADPPEVIFGSGKIFGNQIIAAKRGSYELALARAETLTEVPPEVHIYDELIAQNSGSTSGVWGLDLGEEENSVLDRWCHIGIGFSGSPGKGILLFDGRAFITEGPFFFNKQTIFDSASNLYIGGIEYDRDGSFPGFIDEVRISDVLRYIDDPDLPELWRSNNTICVEYDPPGRFESDEHTRGLWHFDEDEGETEFRDSSGNNNTLIGEDGAEIVGALTVEPLGNSLTTWGKIKGKY